MRTEELAGITGFWPMFFFGFVGIFIITHIHGFGLSDSVMTRWIIFGVYSAMVVSIVLSFRGWDIVFDMVAIPLIDYILVFVISLITFGLFKFIGFVNFLMKRRPSPTVE